MTDAPKQAEKSTQEPEAATTEYVEFIGWAPFGTEFSGGHSISRKHMSDVHDIKMSKDLEWKKGGNGRFLVKAADVDPAALAYLKTDPAFKIVNL